MNMNQTVSVPVSSVPTHIVVWHEGNATTAPSATNELVELRKRVEELEKMVRSLVSQPRLRTVSEILSGRRMSSSDVSAIETPEDAQYQSPYFTATRVIEPVGLSVVTTPLHTATIAPHIPEIKVFEDIVEAAAAKKVKTVTLNGMNFACHTWKGDTIYCQESTGRAFIDPKDAFNDPDAYSIGYWDAAKGRLEQKESMLDEVNQLDEIVEVNQLEEVEEEEEEVVEEEVQQEEEEVEEEEVVEEVEKEEVVEEEVVEEEVLEEEVEEEEAEEAMELEEIEYKGVTYYKDAQNQIYQMDANGDLDDTPIGVWNEQKQKVLKYR